MSCLRGGRLMPRAATIAHRSTAEATKRSRITRNGDITAMVAAPMGYPAAYSTTVGTARAAVERAVVGEAGGDVMPSRFAGRVTPRKIVHRS
ncbi:hypothetical protein GCM10009722_17800 [Williamsia deligens]